MTIVLFPLLNAALFATYAAMVGAWTWAIGRYRAGKPLISPVEPRVVPWGAASTGAVIIAWIFARLLAVDAFVALTGRSRTLPFSFLEQMTLACLWNGLILIMVPSVLALTSRASLRDLGVHSRAFVRQTIFGAFAFLLVAVPIYLINYSCVVLTSLITRAWEPNKHPVEKMVRENFSGEVAYLAVLSAIVLAPAAEELFFRGVIQSWLFKAIRGALRPSVEEGQGPLEPGSTEEGAAPVPLPEALDVGESKAYPRRIDRRAEWLAIGLTSIFFALAHWEQWPAPVAIFFLSLALGFVYQRTGSLWSSFVLHAFFNGLSTAVLFWSILGSDPLPKSPEPREPHVTAPAPESKGQPQPADSPVSPINQPSTAAKETLVK